MKHIPEPDVAGLRDPGASVNRLAVHSTWRSRRPLQMLSSTWQVTGVSGTVAELIERTPHQRDFEATSIPGILELDGLWVRREEEARRAAEAGGEPTADRVRASILRREFIFDAPLKEAVERGWMMTLTFGGFSGPLYAWVDGTFVGFCADGFIPAAFDVTGALQPTHSHTLAVLLMDSPVCCHGLFREVSLEARPPAHIVDVVPVASHDGRAGTLTLRVETTGGVEVHAALVNETEQERLWSAVASPDEVFDVRGLDVIPWSAEEPALYRLIVTLRDEEGVKDTVSLDLGFRDLTATPEGLRLAGRPLTLRGVRRNECDGRTGLAVNIPEMLEDIVWCKRHGVNAVAIEQGPAHACFYELADQYGLYIIDRASTMYGPGPARDEAIEAMIRRDRAHPSVVAWNVGEEDEDIRAARALDPTRREYADTDFPLLSEVRAEELHYAPVTVAPSYSGVTVRNHMTFTSTCDLEFLCRVVEDGAVTWEYPAFLDVAPGETGFLPVEWPASGMREVSVRLSYGTGWAPAGFEIGRGVMPVP